MKKVALSLMALAVVAAGAFADAPKWDPKVSTEFKGAASVTLGYDLDTGISAFSNDTSVSLIVDLVSGGDRTSASDKDVWGEIKIKTDGDPYRIKADDLNSDGKATFEQGFKLQVDYAKIHFGKAAYLSVTSHDTKLGYSNSPDLAFLGHWFRHNVATSDYVAVAGDASNIYSTYYTDSTGTYVASPVVGTKYTKWTWTRYGAENGVLVGANSSVGAANAGGIEFGYSLDKVASLTVDVGTVDAWSTALVNSGSKTNVAYAAKVGLLAVDNLTVEVGYSAQTKADTGKVIGGKVAYTYKIDGDNLYVKPQAGFVNITPDGASAKAYNSATASVLLGTGAKAAQFDNYGLKLDSDYGAYPGVSVGVFYDDKDVVNDTNNKKADIGFNLSANSGSLIKDTTVVAAVDVKDLNAANLMVANTFGVSTTVKSGDVSIAPKAIFVYEIGDDQFVAFKTKTTGDLVDTAAFLKASADVTGVIPFVTFTVAYESNDLLNGYIIAAGAGAFGDGQKMGKFELTTKVSF